jgi:hypothetical protein
LGEQRSCDGRGGAQRPVSGGYELKKTGARSARARTRGQNPLVKNNVCTHNCVNNWKLKGEKILLTFRKFLLLEFRLCKNPRQSLKARKIASGSFKWFKIAKFAFSRK